MNILSEVADARPQYSLALVCASADARMTTGNLVSHGQFVPPIVGPTVRRLLLDHATLDEYVRYLLPGGARSLGQPWHVKRGRSAWVRARDLDGDVPLSALHIRRHLLGEITVGLCWPSVVDRFEFDLDHKRDPVTRQRPAQSPMARLALLQRVLDTRAGVVWRSSSSGGWRWTVRLDREVDAVELRKRMIEKLNEAGVQLRPGHIELWPAASSCRLPLGAGSYILESESDFATPCAFTYGNAARPVRNLARSVAVFNEQTNAERFDYDTLSQARVSVAVPAAFDPCPTIYVEKKGAQRGAAEQAPTSCTRARSAYWDNFDIIKQGARDGRRVRDGYDFLFASYIAQGLDRQETLTAYEHWLETAAHTSKDLTAHRDATVRAMMSAAPKTLDDFDTQLAEGTLTRGSGRKRAHPGVALQTIIAERKAADSKQWRAVATAKLTDDDRKLVAGESDAWLRGCLEVLIGLLRHVELDHGTMPTSMTMSVRALKAIAGGRMRDDLDGWGRVAGYMPMVLRACRLGILGGVVERGRKSTPGKFDGVASVYAIKLKPVGA